jgi:hypothetical protein
MDDRQLTKPKPIIDQEIDEASADSFPASDPPGWTGGATIGSRAPLAPRPVEHRATTASTLLTDRRSLDGSG